jgi:hypothetical protein
LDEGKHSGGKKPLDIGLILNKKKQFKYYERLTSVIL